MAVDGLHDRAGTLGLRPRPERDQVERAQGAAEPPPQVVAVVGMLGDSDRDERMRDLQQHGGAAAEERRHGRVADAADHALGREVPVAAREPLRVRPPVFGRAHASSGRIG
ncbi:MAG TPA: hypothetical protein VFB17_03510 [Gaiellaceae bacterium]|nr:hypothetical protein [Gaiellaceae bacterium]